MKGFVLGVRGRSWSSSDAGVFTCCCSSARGRAVFTCGVAAGRLTCRNRGGHGFRVTSRGFNLL